MQNSATARWQEATDFITLIKVKLVESYNEALIYYN